MKENKEIEAVVSDVDNKGTKTFEVKKEKIYKRKDLITTAIIAFLIGAIITAGGFAFSKAIKGGRKDRDFRTNGIQRNINQDDLNNGQNGYRGRMNGKGNLPDNAQNSNNQNPPNMKNNNQNPPSMPNNEQQPNNSNTAPSVPNTNEQNSTSNKS